MSCDRHDLPKPRPDAFHASCKNINLPNDPGSRPLDEVGLSLAKLGLDDMVSIIRATADAPGIPVGSPILFDADMAII